MKTAALALLFSAVARCQATPAPEAFKLPENWAGAGAGCKQGHPSCAGWASYAHLISKSGPVYSYSTYDITWKGSAIPVTSARTGFATTIKQVGRVVVLAFGTAGVATAGNATTGSYSGGGVGMYVFKSGLTIEEAIRYVSVAGVHQPVYELGVGRAW